MIPWLSAALLTFLLGVAITAAICSMNSAGIIPPVVVQDDEVRLPPVGWYCYPGRSIQPLVMSDRSHFPSNVLSHNEWSAEFRSNWYSRHLRAMNEEPLYSSDDRWLESYRFLWLRTFHHPVAVRLWKRGAEKFIVVKELSGAGGYEPGELIVNHTRKLSAAEWNQFARRLDDTCYWQLPTEDDELGGTDGAQWIFEGFTLGRYHIVDRWTPESGSYRELCLYALQLSGLKIDKDVY